MPKGNANPPLVIFAFDAGDADFIQQWVQDGALPNLAAVMQRGCWSTISGHQLFSEFGQWISLLAGVTRQRHGYYYFRQLEPGTYNLLPFSHLDTGLLPFWAHLRGTGKKVATIDAPECAPVSGLDGIQLSGWSARHLPQRILPMSAVPPQLFQEARRVFGKRVKIVDFAPNSTPGKDLTILHLMLDRIEKKGRLCRHLLTKDRYDLMVIGYYEAHDASHRFWDYQPGRDLQQLGEASELGPAIRLVYQAIDRELGRLLTSLPAETIITVVSCYGMGSGFPTTGLLDSFCHELGYQVRSANPIIRGPLDLFRGLLPQPWRAAISEHLPVPIQERLLADYFRSSTDWSRTRAFAVPSAHTSFLRVNLQEREPQGCVCPGKDYETLLDRLATDLAGLIDPVTGESAIERIERADLVSGGVPPVSLPDLFVKWKEQTHFVDRLVHPDAKVRQSPAWFHRSSAHSEHGFFAAAGSSIATRGRIGNVSILSLAPTLLGLMGEASPAELTGEPIYPILSNGDFPKS